jgi:hypothetical protein
LFYFDVELVYLQAAFDGLARLAHLIHELTGKERLSRWRKAPGEGARACRDAVVP